jgi:DNA replication and repair protein RecF
MHLRQLELIDFRNFDALAVRFGPGVHCLTGPNGSGKTNLLDAIHYLSLCRSYFAATDVQNVRHGRPFFMVRGVFAGDGGEDTVACSVQPGRRKQFLCNGKPYPRMLEHIGRFPVVMIAPADQALVTGGSGDRRRFMDRLLGQTDRGSLEDLMAYQRVLEQRNALCARRAAPRRTTILRCRCGTSSWSPTPGGSWRGATRSPRRSTRCSTNITATWRAAAKRRRWPTART